MLVLIFTAVSILLLPTVYNNLAMYGMTKLFYFRMQLQRWPSIAYVFDRLFFWPMDYVYRNAIGAPQYMVGLKYELMSDLVHRYLTSHIQLTKDIRGLCKKHNVTPKDIMRTAISLGYFDVITAPEGHDEHFGDPSEFR